MTSSRHRITRIIAAAMVMVPPALNATAQAQPQLSLPTGITSDRFSTDPVAASIDFGFTRFDVPAISYAMRVDFYGQILSQFGAHRAGGYAALPYARMRFDDGLAEDVIGELGHLELGGLFATAAGVTTDAVLRGGVAVGLDEDEIDDEEDLARELLVVSASYGRLSEALISTPEVTWVRLSGSLLHRSDPYIVRADLGLDIPFVEGDDDTVLVRANLAAGVDVESVALLAELSNLANLDSDVDEHVLSTLAFSVSLPLDAVSGYMGASIPLDDILQEVVDFVVVAGVRVTSGTSPAHQP